VWLVGGTPIAEREQDKGKIGPGGLVGNPTPQCLACRFCDESFLRKYRSPCFTPL
jgi:hypothetical protein